MPYDIPKLTENPFVLISGFVLVITSVLIAVVLSRYAAETYKGNRKKATLLFAGITAFVTLILFCFLDVLQPHSRALFSACSSYSPLMRIYG